MTVRGEVIVHRDAEALARAGAEAFAELAREAVARFGRFSVCLTGGSSPRRLYEILGEDELASRVPWDAVHLFWGDDRVVPPAHPRSNYGMAHSSFVSRVPIPPENVHRIRGEEGARAASERYEAELREHFGSHARFDLLHLGLGDDGHVASLFPFDRRAHDERERWVTTSLLRELGEARVTLTFPLINAAARVEFLVGDPAKAAVARAVLAGSLDPYRIPAQWVAVPAGDLAWRVTAGVAAEIPEIRAPATSPVDRSS